MQRAESQETLVSLRPREVAYDAFISYSHAVDQPMAKSVQRVLHRLGRRWYHTSALRVFRDDTTLAASSDLWESIERALLVSRTFVLLASPEAANSKWVDREVALWQEKRSPDSFLMVLTAGDLVWDEKTGDFDWGRTTALPQRLRGWFHAEPLWVDLREDWDSKGWQLRRQGIYRSRVATVAAAIHGVPKEELLSGKRSVIP